MALTLTSTASPTRKPSPPPPYRRLRSVPPPPLLKHYSHVASTLARTGRLRDFLQIAESILTSDALSTSRSKFRIDTEMIAEGIAAVLNAGGVEEVVDFMNRARKLGICSGRMFNESAKDALAAECGRLLQEGRLEEFVVLIEDLAGYGLLVKDIVDPIGTLKIFVDKRNPDMAIRYASVFPHSELLFCTIIKEFVKKKDKLSAIRVFEASNRKSGGVNMFACRSIIDICGLCGDFLKSRSIFEDLLSQKITPNIYVFNSLMNVNAHDLSYTFYAYKHMQNLGVTADMTSYNILLKACCHAKRVDLAQDIYKEIYTMKSKGALKLDVITYSSMIKVFADAKMWQMAMNIKEDMLLANVNPNIVTWSSLVSACASAGLVDRAVQVFEEMLQAGCKPNTQCCNILLNACVASCQYDKAFRFFDTWKENGFKIHTSKTRRYYGHAVSTVKPLTQSDSSHSTSFCGPQPASAVVPFIPTVATFNILMKACGTDHHRAKSLMDEMKMMGFSPDYISWSILIDIYGISHNIRDAMQAFKSMQDAGIKLDVVAYTTAIKACVENRSLKMAFSLFEEMKRYHFQPNWVTYNTLLRARSRYGSLHEVKQSLTLYQDMRRAGYSANDYYLKELIEEWCEGVICNSSPSQDLPSIDYYCEKNDTINHHTLLLEKVATHLQKDVGDNQAIDTRGLTKVEARIVVLSVLRMIKENHQTGKAITDDLIIIAGSVKESTESANYQLEVRQAIIDVLQNELGLDVIITGYGAVFREAPSSPSQVVGGSAVAQKTELLNNSVYLARRPQDLGLLKVTRASLNNWLRKASRRKAVLWL